MTPTIGQKTTIEFNDGIVRQFMLASLIWGIVGMLVGVLIATQLNYWQANFGQAWLSFGRLRPGLNQGRRHRPQEMRGNGQSVPSRVGGKRVG